MAAVISICLLPSAAELEDKQMSKVTFDYSKAAPFIGAHEVDFMKKQVMDARELLFPRPVREMIFLAGSICRLIMIRKSLTELKKQRLKSRVIQKCFWLSELVVLIWEQELQLNF